MPKKTKSQPKKKKSFKHHVSHLMKKVAKKMKKAVKRTAQKTAGKPAKKTVRKPLRKTSISEPLKNSKKAPAKKTTPKKTPVKLKLAALEAKPIGEVTHYYGGLKVAIVRFNKDIRVGTLVRFKGATTDFSQSLDSVQFNHAVIDVAKKGLEVGVKVAKKCREGDRIHEA